MPTRNHTTFIFRENSCQTGWYQSQHSSYSVQPYFSGEWQTLWNSGTISKPTDPNTSFDHSPSKPHWISNVCSASYVSMHVFRCPHVFTVWIPSNSLWDIWLHFILIDRKAFWTQEIYFINNCSLTPDSLLKTILMTFHVAVAIEDSFHQAWWF